MHLCSQNRTMILSWASGLQSTARCGRRAIHLSGRGWRSICGHVVQSLAVFVLWYLELNIRGFKLNLQRRVLTELLQRGDLQHAPVHDPPAPVLPVLLQLRHLPLDLPELALHRRRVRGRRARRRRVAAHAPLDTLHLRIVSDYNLVRAPSSCKWCRFIHFLMRAEPHDYGDLSTRRCAIFMNVLSSWAAVHSLGFYL